MEIVRITRSFSFEMAHFLPGYDGPCSHVHGHSFKLYVTVSGQPFQKPENPKDGMIMDFHDLKKIVEHEIVNKYDHALLVKKGALEVDQQNNFAFQNIIGKDYQPTSEMLILEFASVLKDNLPEKVILHSLKLYETEKSFVEWYRNDQP